MRSWAPHFPALVFLSSQLADQSGIREQFRLPHNTIGVPEWQQTTRVNPTPCHAVEIIKQGYSLRLARRPPRFSCVVPTSVQSKDAHVLRSEVMALLAKGAINGPSSPERVMLLQPLLPRPQKDSGLPHPRSQNPEPHPHETAVQDDFDETNPLANMPRGLVLFPGSERRLLSHPDSPSPQAILEILLRGCGLSVHGPALWTVPGYPHFYEVHGRGSFPSKTDGNPHSQLPQWLACSRPVRGGMVVVQIPPFQPLRVHGTQGQICQARIVSQPTDIVPGNSFQLGPNEGCSHTRVCSGHTAARGLFSDRSLSPSQIVSENAGPYGFHIPSAQLGLLRIRPLQRWLKPRVPSDPWRHGPLQIKVNRAWRVDSPSASSSGNMGDLWQGRGRPLRLKRQLSLPDVLFEGHGCVGPRMENRSWKMHKVGGWAKLLLYAFSKIDLMPQVIRYISQYCPYGVPANTTRLVMSVILWSVHHRNMCGSQLGLVVHIR